MVIAKAPKCTELVSRLDSRHLPVSYSTPVCTLVLFLDLSIYVTVYKD